MVKCNYSRRWLTKKKSFLLTDQQLQDLNPLVAGHEACDPGHSYGPHIRSYVLLHFVHSGKGTFQTPDGTFCVEEGQAFMILPGQLTTYTADSDDPWEYSWVGFNGALSHRFHTLTPVFPIPDF